MVPSKPIWVKMVKSGQKCSKCECCGMTTADLFPWDVFYKKIRIKDCYLHTGKIFHFRSMRYSDIKLACMQLAMMLRGVKLDTLHHSRSTPQYVLSDTSFIKGAPRACTVWHTLVHCVCVS